MDMDMGFLKLLHHLLKRCPTAPPASLIVFPMSIDRDAPALDVFVELVRPVEFSHRHGKGVSPRGETGPGGFQGAIVEPFREGVAEGDLVLIACSLAFQEVLAHFCLYGPEQEEIDRLDGLLRLGRLLDGLQRPRRGIIGPVDFGPRHSVVR